MKNILKNLVTSTVIGLVTLFPIKNASGSDGVLKYVHPTQNGVSDTYNEPYLEQNAFYNLPKGIKGFTWVQMYNKGGFFGESNFEKEIAPNLNVKLQGQHSNNLLERVGFGLSYKLPFLPKDLSVKLTTHLAFFDTKGKRENEGEVSYSISTKLPHGVKAGSFGEVNLANKGGAKWNYGEIYLKKALTPKIGIGYNGGLISDGNLTPNLQHRVSAEIKF